MTKRNDSTLSRHARAFIAGLFAWGMYGAATAEPELHPPELVHFVEANYPPPALAARVEGTVVLRLEIDASGAVREAAVITPSGHGFDEAASAAASAFRFKPARRGDQPIASRIHYRYEFRLPPKAPSAPPPSAAAFDAPPQAAAAPPPSAAAIEVQVQGDSAAERMRESAQSVKVIETAEAERRTADLGEVLARTEGVAVQRSGGLGSDTRLSLHGLTDDQIRVFLDGVPLEFSGFGLGVSSVPVSWTDRIDVYRGVVPVRLGTDALGGALDLISESTTRGTSASGYYSGGSFDTHQLGLNARTYDAPSGFSLRTAGFLDTTQNDYVVDVRVPDARGRLQPARVRRFHDAYRAAGGMIEGGVANRPWARRLSLRVFATDFDKELQHNVDMTTPYGEASYGETAFGGTLRYDQPRLAKSRVGLGLLAGISHRALFFEDTSRWTYDWFGRRVSQGAAGSGETDAFASDLTQRENRFLGRSTLTFDLARGHLARWVVAPEFTTRTGEERLRAREDRLDPLTTRREIFQLTSGVEYEVQDEDRRFENSLFAKYYLYRPSADQVRTFDNSIQPIEDTIHRAGAGDAFRMRILDGLSAKLSYEYATRLPRSDEVFGDGSSILPNLELTPESSHNANAGLLFEREVSRQVGTLSFEATGFLRYTENMIVRLLAEDRVHAIHQNVFSARTLGVDGMLGWVSSQRWIRVRTNSTLQDQRNVSTEGPFAPFDGERVPNRPWFFVNGSVELRIPRVGTDNGELSLQWITRYVHSFWPGWIEEADANDDNHIPSQFTHAVSIVYSVLGPWRVDLALDLTNISDERVYDVLGVQKAGRAAFFKITVSYTKGTAP